MYKRLILAALFTLTTVSLVWMADGVRGFLVIQDTELRQEAVVPFATPEPDGKKSRLGGSINYTAVGDSLAVGLGASAPSSAYVARFAQFLATDNNATVNVANLAVSGTTSAQLLTALQTDTAMRSSVQGADVITFNVGSNDFLVARNSYRAVACGGADNQDCLRTAIAQFKTNWTAIIQEILSLRASPGVNVRTIDLYYPFVDADTFTDSFPSDGGLNDFQVLNSYLDDADDHIRSSSLTSGIALGRVHRSFNGTNGSFDPNSIYGIISGDLFHPNDRGHSVIADRLRSGTPTCLQSPTGLMAWYRAENNANDSTANNNHATLENGPVFAAGKDGQAFDLDGVDDSVLLPTIDLGDLYTIEMWINPAATQGDTFVHLASNDSGAAINYGELGLFTNTPGTPGNYSLKYRQNSSDRVITAAVIQPGVWTHVALTHDPEARIYVNGILSGSSGVQFNAAYNNQLRLGHRIAGTLSFYKGRIDEVSLYDRAMSAAEIGTIVDADSAGKCVASDLQIAPTSASINAGSSQIFTATGGVSPYVFSISSNPPLHGTIDSATGEYIGTGTGVDTVQVTDAALFTSQATVTVSGVDTVCPTGQKVWDGGGSTNNWNDAGNWCGNTLPATSANIVFDATSVKNANVNVNTIVNGINIAAGYAGTILVANNTNFSVQGNGTFVQSGGTFTNGSGTTTITRVFALNAGTFNVGTGSVSFSAFNATQNGGTFNDVSVVNSGNIDFAQAVSLTVNNGVFNAPGGTLTFAGDFNFNGGTFNHRNSTVVFGGATNIFLRTGSSASDVVFNDLNINRANGTADVIIDGLNRVVRVSGTLTLTEGAIGINSGSLGIRAEGPVNIGAGFGDPTSSTPGGIGIVQLQDGPAGRIVSIPAGAALPRLVVNDPNLTVNTVGAGSVLVARLTLQRGVVNVPAADITAGIGSVGGICFDQSGGSFSFGSGNFLCNTQFQLTEPDGANPSTFAGGTGTFTVGVGTGFFTLSGGTFTAPSGGVLLNIGVAGNYVQSGVSTFNSGTGPFNCACGQFLLQGGTFNATTGTTTIGRVFNRSAGGTFNPNGGTVVFTSTPGGSMGGVATTFHNLTIAFSGNNHQVFATTTGTLRLQSGILDNNGSSLTAEGDVVIENGFGGANSPMTFSGAGTQNYTNNGAPNPTGLWTINKPSGTINLNSDLDVSNGTANFLLQNGNIVTGAHVVDAGARFVSGSASSFVMGNLRRSYAVGSQNVSLGFQVGSAAGYAPVSVAAGGVGGPAGTRVPLKVSVVGSTHPLFDPAGSLSMYWAISEGVGIVNADVTFNYPEAAVHGVEANYRLDRVENGGIEILPNLITISTNTVTLDNINNFAAEWTMSELPPPLILTCPPPLTVNPGTVIHCTASGGRSPYQFTLPVNNSGATVQTTPSSAFYTAGPGFGTDTLRVKDFLNSTQEVQINVVDPYVVVNTNGSGGGSLEQAVENSNNAAGTQTITFNIPGPPPYVITTDHALNITDTVVIDGFTQPNALPNPLVEVRNSRVQLFASNSTIKGLIINGNTGGSIEKIGLYIGGNASGNLIQKNYFGIDSTIFNAVPNDIGIKIQGDGNTLDGNVVAGNNGYGILIESTSASPASNNVIKKNFIGADQFLGPQPNGLDGIRLIGAQGTIIGGTVFPDGNFIHYNHGAGISTFNYYSNIPTVGNSIRGNSMRLNDGPGIDLRPGGVNANDPCDADSGDNRAQNYPEMTSVVSFGGNTFIDGTLNGEPNKTYVLDFYSNSNTQTDESGFGEGFAHIGSGQVTTPSNCSGPTPFSVTIPLTILNFTLVTATATDPEGNTSEFSHFQGIQPADITGTIRNASNSPMQGVAVLLQNVTTNRLVATGTTDKSGRFKFANVAVGQDYRVLPKLSNFIFVPASRTYNTVTTSQNDSYSGIVNSFSISGHVTMNGFSQSNADVSLTGSASATKKTNSNGDFSFDGLPSGTYTVSVNKTHVVFNPSTMNFPTPITSNQTANFDGVFILSTVPGRIVYEDEIGNIKQMNPDGSGIVTVLPKTSSIAYSTPRFSRDGTKLVFTDRAGWVRTGSADGAARSSQLRSCTQPTFSPDSAQIACREEQFVPNASSTDLTLGLFNSADGSGYDLLTPLDRRVNSNPDWKPNGPVIAFTKAETSHNPPFVWRINTNTHTQALTSPVGNGGSRADYQPRWSPNGNKLVTNHRFTHPQTGLEQSAIAVMDGDGGNLQRIAGSGVGPVWSSDGQRIFYLIAGSTLWTTLPDGTDPLNVMNNFEGITFDFGPDNEVSTPAGANTQVQSGRVTITFPATSGVNKTTTITPIDPSAAGSTPGGFVVDGFAYELSTTANFVPPAEVCIFLHNLIEPSMAQFASYRFMHNEGGVMMDRTSVQDFNARKICGSLPSFSPVALMKQVDPAMPSISGLVVDQNGDPISDVQVMLDKDQTPVMTNHLGQFEFVNLNTGANYSVLAAKAGYMFSPPLQTFNDLSGDQTVVFGAVPATFDITGSVVDGSNVPKAGVLVQLKGSRETETLTAADGTFTFPDLPANGEFKVRAVPDNGNSSTPVEISIDALQSDITGLLFTQFVPTAAGVSISGRIATKDGMGIGRAQLTLTSRSGATLTALTSPFGYFKFEDVQAGETYILEASHKRYQFFASPRVLTVIDELIDVDFTGSDP